MDKDERIEDIALFFSDKGKERRCWVSHSVYTAESRFYGPVDEAMQAAIVSQNSLAGGPYYVTNLANLDAPGEGPNDQAGSNAQGAARPASAQRKEIKVGDIIVIPFSEPKNAYLVPKTDYMDNAICPEILETTGADLRFMANTEGVVLANIPKTDLAGMTCYLLNLRALRWRK
jgi:hypothetical protein